MYILVFFQFFLKFYIRRYKIRHYSVYVKNNKINKYPNYKPFRLLTNKFQINIIPINKSLKLTIDDISRIGIIHALRKEGEIKDKVTDTIYLDKNAYMISKNNLELINYLDQSIIIIGGDILKVSTEKDKSNLNRLYTKIIL
tara:strand:- start:920 stop:1345 length:426 start_codon:yes stop_codon:yes gene_type:complete